MKKLTRWMAAAACMVLLTSHTIQAAEAASAMNAYTDSEQVVLYIKDPGKDIDHVYLGNAEAKEFTVEEAGPVRTVVVLDNSLSIQQKYRDTIRTFLTDLVAARNDGDTFTIATFAEQVNYLVQDSSDYLEMKAQIDALTFVDQESYFTNVLYTVMNDISQYEEMKYTRVIVIADGVDNEALGYTDDELNRKIRTVRVPVYAVGCTSRGNEENLKKMFALSRMSNGKTYLLDETAGTEILKDILSDGTLKKITVTPQNTSCDGSVQPVRVCFGEDYCTAEVTMPFQAVTSETETSAEQESEAAEVPETQSEATAQVQPETVAASPEEAETGTDGFVLMVLSGTLTALAVIVILVTVKLKKLKRRSDSDTPIDLSQIGNDPDDHTEEWNESGSTEMLGASSADAKNADKTDYLVDRKAVRLILQDTGNPARSFEYPLRDKVIIGKDAKRCQIVIDYNRFVSGVHCEIVSRGDSIYVRDGGGDVIASTNGTFVNGRKAAPELPLPSGAVLKLGEISFKVTYK